MADDVRAFEFGPRLGQDARAIERDIAVADNGGVGPGEKWVEIGEFGMAVVPADELGRADDPGQVLARNAELAVVRRSGGEDHRVIELKQLGDRDVTADRNVADEVDARALGDLVVALADGLQRLVVWRHAEADQPIGDGITVEDVDPRLISIGLVQRLGGVEARRTRSDHREMPHAASLLLREA